MKRVLFVCTGNTCRSPMAQGLLNHLANEEKLSVQATSAGLAADGDPISPNALAVLREIGIDMSYHRSRFLNENDIENANAVFCMTQSQLLTVVSIYPSCADRLYLLGGGIEDPFGGNLDIYRACRDKIRDALPEVLKALGENVDA